MKQVIRITLVLAAGAMLTFAQQAQPRPKSQKEVEALQAIQAATTPDARIAAVENLLTNFADTDFKPFALLVAMQTAQQKGDFAQTMVYGERALEADPKGYYPQIIMAGELARHTREFDLDKEEKLSKAEKYATSAITNLQTATKPNPNVTDEQWASAKKDMVAQAHDVLGMIALVRKKPDVAITEFNTAVTGASQPDPSTVVKLGQAYLDAKQYDNAMAQFDKASTMAEASAAVKSIANQKKAEIAKLKGGAGATGSAGAATTTTPRPATTPASGTTGSTGTSTAKP